MVPKEEGALSHLRAELQAELALCDRLVALGVDIVERRAPTITPDDTLQVPYRVGKTICIRAIKLFRDSLLLAANGGDESNIDVLGRILFETYIAINFVLKESVQLGLKNVDDAQLTMEKRAKIYMAHGLIKKYYEWKAHQESGEYTELLKHCDTEGWQKQTDGVVTMVGQDWSERFQKHPYTYSGLSLKMLTKKLDPSYFEFYNVFYGPQSRAVHANEPGNHVEMRGEQVYPKWHADPETLRKLLAVNGILCTACLGLLDERFQLEGDTDQELGIIGLFNQMIDRPLAACN